MTTSAEPQTALLVFARAPVAGAAKTRLMPELGAAGAALLHERMTRHALATALRASVGPVQLWCSPSTHHAFFAACRNEYAVTLHAQRGSSLGARLRYAHDAAFGAHRRIVLIGTDCPMLTVEHLIRAASSLDDHDAALVPAEDGGYVLLGLSQPCPRAFAAIDWGSDRVLAQTRARLAQAGLRVRVADPLWDVDRPQDLDRLRQCLPALVAGLGAASP